MKNPIAPAAGNPWFIVRNDRLLDPMPSCLTHGTSSVGDIQCQDDTGPSPAAAARGRPPPGTLGLSIHRRGAVIELGLSGDLDMATAACIGKAMAWLRSSSGPATTIVIDRSDVDFVAAAGYHAMQATLVRADGLWDPHVVVIVGPALVTLEAAISASSPRAPGAEQEVLVGERLPTRLQGKVVSTARPAASDTTPPPSRPDCSGASGALTQLEHLNDW
jgi:hypothetical protein